jgi:tetratricopeptide (TPR) repeat protein
MKKRFLVRACMALVTVSSLFAVPQTQQAAPGGGLPVAKQPRVKSQAEGEALQAIFQAADPEARIKAAEEFLGKYADSEFRALCLMVEAETYRQKNDYEHTVIYGERTLEADPQNYMAMLMLASSIAQRTREFDLDREEKLGRAEKYAKSALELIKTSPKPRPDVTDEQWIAARADFTAQAHEALALAAMVRKNYPVAIAEFKTAIESGSSPDPATQVRLGAVYNMAGQHDDAIAILTKVMEIPDVHPQIKQVAQAERARAMQAKGGAAKPAAPAPAAPPAEPKP